MTHPSSLIPHPSPVSLVGAGPGDPGLITVRGREVLEKADVVVYDNLVNPHLLRQARPEAELIYVGKQAGRHTMTQEAINELLVGLARQGKQVVRLKGGDPFVFGRGGEEAQALQRAGIAFEVVPGISSAIAAAAYAGIPITHRDYASSFTVVTGHEDPQRPLDDSRIDWKGLVRTGGTLVFLMGVGRLHEIAERLIEAGQSPLTPAALVEWGTTWQQKTVSGTLSNLPELARQAGIKPPAITIIGPVVGLREQLRWFDLEQVRPLLGKRIVIGGADQALAERLNQLGAQASQFPISRAVAPVSFAAMDEAINGLSRFDWLIFASPLEVEFFWQRLRFAGKDSRALAGLRVGALGAATTTALEQHGLFPDLSAEAFETEAILNGLGQVTGQKFWLLQAGLSQVSLASKLTARRASVEHIAAYRTVVDEDPRVGGLKAIELVKWLEAGQVDQLYFNSAVTLLDFTTHLATATTQPLLELLANTAITCHGSFTTATARELGLKVALTLDDSVTLGEVVEAIVGWGKQEPSKLSGLALAC